MVGLGITRWLTRACLLRTLHKGGVKELIRSLKFKFKCMSKITRLSGKQTHIKRQTSDYKTLEKSGRSTQYPLVSTYCNRKEVPSSHIILTKGSGMFF